MADVQQNILINIDVESGNVTSQLDTINEKIGGLGKVVNLKSFQSVRAEIAAAREEAVRLALAIDEAEAAGQNVDALSQRYSEVTKRAAELRDAVEDTNASIANANPDNRLQGLVSIAQGAIVAIQGVAGAFTLLGVDAETANVAIAKLQGIIALTSALESINKVTQAYRDFTAVVNLAAVAQRANNAATVAATVVQRLFTGSVVATGAAFTALRVAIAATGIGLLVIGVAAAVKAFIDFKNATNEAAEAQAKLTAEVERAASAYDDEVSAAQRASDLIISDLRARGASQDQIRRAQLTAANRNLQVALRREAELQAQFNRALATGNQELLNTINNQIRQNLDEITNLRQAARIAENDIIAAQTQAEVDAANERRDAARRASEEAKQKRIADLREIQQFTEEARLQDRRSRQTELQNEIDDINRKYERLLELARVYRRDTTELEKLRAAEIARVTAQALNQSAIQFRENLVKNLQTSTDLIFERLNQIRQLNFTNQRLFIQTFGETIRGEIQAAADLSAEAQRDLAEFNLERNIEFIRQLTFRTDPAENKRIQDKQIEILRNTFKEEEFALKRVAEELKKRAEFEVTAIKFDIDISEAQNKLQSLGVALDQTLRSFDSRGLGALNVQAERLIQSGVELASTLRQGLQDNLRVLEQTRLRAVEQVRLKYQNLTDEERKSSIPYRREIEQIEIETQNRRVDVIGQFGLRILEAERAVSQSRIQLQQQTADQLSLQSRIVGQDIEPSFARNFLSTERFKERFDAALFATQEFYDQQINLENQEFQRLISDTSLNQSEVERITREHKARLVDIERNYNNDINTINQAAIQARVEILDNIGSAIGSLADIFGRSTKAGKALALADIAIGSATGFIRGLNIAQQTAQGTGPAAAFAFPIFYAQQVAAILAAVSRAKQIIATVPGGGGGGSTPAPPTPQAISSNVFRLPPEAQNVRVVNQQQQVVRAFITNEDLRTAQERQAFLNKLSAF